MPEKITGTIEHVVFHNPENGFAVLRVLPTGRREPVTVVGALPTVVAGEWIEASGAWTIDREHGRQFKADELRTMPPHTVEGIEKFLGSGLIKGIGPHFAGKIVETFGARTLTVIDESPSFLREVKGIGPKRLQRIRASWQLQKAVRDIIVFLQSHGVGTARAVRIYKTYGDQAIALIQANPYRLATDIWGIGFRSADQIAERLGVERASPLRASAAVRFVLQELKGEGHVGYPESAVIDQTTELLGIDRSIVSRAVEAEIAAEEVVREPFAASPLAPGRVQPADAPWLYLKPLFLAETGVARTVCQLRAGPHPLPAIDSGAALGWIEKRMGLELAPGQRQAIEQATTTKVSIITGGPGVGKTTIVRGILDIFAAKGQRCTLCAPTGRAAKRLSETTGRPARTIHRLLEFDPAQGGFGRGRDNPLEFDLVVVDEASMVDVVLMHQLLRAVPASACVVLVGDVDQLPPVGPGTVLADLIRSRALPVVRLTEIFRQAQRSWIVRAAHRVNQGELPESAPALLKAASSPGAELGDFFIIEADSPQAIRDRIIALVRERIPARFGLDPFHDIQVLAPMNRSELGVIQLNICLQEVLNPAGAGPEVQRQGWTFRTGDKVLQTVNNYQKEVFNGDIGRVAAIDPEEQELVVRFDGREVVYDFGELDELALAYALTIHKSQGSEYPAVVIPLHMQHFLLLQRNLLYTGITRGKRLVVLVASRKALATAIQRQDTARRFSALAWRLALGNDGMTE